MRTCTAELVLYKCLFQYGLRANKLYGSANLPGLYFLAVIEESYFLKGETYGSYLPSTR